MMSSRFSKICRVMYRSRVIVALSACCRSSRTSTTGFFFERLTKNCVTPSKRAGRPASSAGVPDAPKAGLGNDVLGPPTHSLRPMFFGDFPMVVAKLGMRDVISTAGPWQRAVRVWASVLLTQSLIASVHGEYGKLAE